MCAATGPSQVATRGRAQRASGVRIRLALVIHGVHSSVREGHVGQKRRLIKVEDGAGALAPGRAAARRGSG